VERSDTHRLELRSMMGIGAQRLNPSYEEFFTASVTHPSTEFILSEAERLRACFFKEG
jgi:hypothetical protein